MKFRVAGFNANKEAVRGRMREAMHVENRMVRLRQLVQREHAKHCRDRRAENGQLKGDGMKAGQLLRGRPPTFMG